MNSFPCSICNEAGHKNSRCPTLSESLRTGFYKPSGGRPISDGDDDEHCKIELIASYSPRKSTVCQNLSTKSATLLLTKQWIWNPILVVTV